MPSAAEPATAPASAPLSSDCHESRDPVAAADALLANRYRLGSWEEVTLPRDLTWTEDPFHDANWRYQLHAARFVLDLVDAGQVTGEARYTARALELMADWVRDNPRVGAPSDMSWNDHSTAQRAVVLACLADQLPWPGWLRDALDLHGRTLADPAFYVGEGNHALNQAIGLLEVGRVLEREDWIDLAGQRIDVLIVKSVDVEGVTNEGSVGYQLYNYVRYGVARERLIAVGRQPNPAFDRVELMPRFLAWATLPNGLYELIGDTVDRLAAVIPGTWAEFAATGGQSGPRPPGVHRVFSAGYLFLRSGWGERRAFRNETAVSVRWGPAPMIHGHRDGGGVTLAAWGSRLLVDPGLYAYLGGAYRSFFTGRQAHNVVTVDGAAWSSAAATRLVSLSAGARAIDVRLDIAGYAGVTHRRRVTYSRALDYLIVEDTLKSSTVRTFRQLWHLAPDARPALIGDVVSTRRTVGNLQIRQLAGAASQAIVTGRTSPIQGWVSYDYATRVPAPVVIATKRGTSARYVTLLVPARGIAASAASGFRLTPGGYTVRVRIGLRTELVSVNGSAVSITSTSR